MSPLPDVTFPNFDLAVPDNGYSWWYVDAISDDGLHALTMIAFIGSVFSPYYARARNRGDAKPIDYCALNVALYGRPSRWSMTERASRSVSRSPQHLQIGPSVVEWGGECLHFAINEVSVPIPKRLCGEIRLWPQAIGTQEFTLDSGGHHRWYPLSPCSRIEVVLSEPRLKWSGQAYWDMNRGARPLEHDFISWNWSRATGAGEPDSTAILYEGLRCNGEDFCLALLADSRGEIEPFDAPPSTTLRPTRFWQITRSTRADKAQAKVQQTLEDTPFYSRSLLQTRLAGKSLTAVHESLSLQRFCSSWVRCLLPFRMPRIR